MGAMGDPQQQTALPPAGSDIFGQYDRGVAFASAVILLLAISAIDKLTGFEIRLQVLYLIPVAIATWTVGRAWGLALSVAAVTVWLVMFSTSHNYSRALYHYWDGGVWLLTLVVFVLLLSRLREEMEWSSADFVRVLDELDATIYVVDLKTLELLYGNQRFRRSHGEESAESLKRRPAKECAIRWPDGRRALLRILS